MGTKIKPLTQMYATEAEAWQAAEEYDYIGRKTLVEGQFLTVWP